MQQNKSKLIVSCSRKKNLISKTILNALSNLVNCPYNILWSEICVEFDLNTISNKYPLKKAVKEKFKDFEIDFNIINYNKDNPRRKKLLIADMDSTLVKSETLNDLADLIGIGDQVRIITNLAMEGKINFIESLIKRTNLLKGQNYKSIETIRNTICYNQGAKELVRTMKNNGSVCALATGGFKDIAEKVSSDLMIDYFQANTIEVNNKIITGRLKKPIHDQESKLKYLIKLAKNLNIPLTHTCSIGDGANDIDMIKASSMGVAFKGKQKLKEIANYRLDFSDLTGLLFLQGYTRKEIEHS